ncbi:MAG: hypothetical protein RLZZ387_1577 [Chloroflexota bacterium]
MLSRGGMGAIYLAYEVATGRMVVVKALADYFDPTDTRRAGAARERLAQEAETLASLSHPSIPRMLGALDDGAQVYLVMEHVAGLNLEQGLSHGADSPGLPHPLRDVLRWGVALCHVLEYLAARPQPVIHHDIKPANVLVDVAGDRVSLVDFGTAQARLDPGGEVGLAESSLYGTVGYAPPEQYRGQSEPRSDVYALAATLYHLATDDDPGEHPFSFPRLESLGAFGEALGVALSRDARQRPFPAMLRGRLESLLAEEGAAALRAPDGVWLPDRAALAEWCLRAWDDAARWLYDALPDQVERWWGDGRLAGALRRLVREQPDRDMGLDKALALLDPRIGREAPRLVADTGAVDFGVLPGSLLRRDIRIENSGRRFVSLYVFLPRWVSGSSMALRLPPGARTTLSLTPDLGKLYFGGRLRAEVLVRDHYGRGRQDEPLLRIALRARVPRRYILGRRYRLPLGGAGLALLIWAGAGLPMPRHAPTSLLEARLIERSAGPASDVPDLPYHRAESHFASGEYAQALEQLRLHFRQERGTPQERALLHEVLYQEGKRLLDQGSWSDARALLTELLAASPGYRDASTLLSQSHYRAAVAALARDDLAGARAELRALLRRQPGSPDAAALQRQLTARERGRQRAQP